MNLTAELKQMKSSGKLVVSIDYILRHLADLESHDTTYFDVVEVPSSESLYKPYKPSGEVMKGGEA